MAESAADVLADRSRARLYALLTDRSEPATTSELATALQLHPNGVRRHLGALESVGLVTREQTEGARGRPADIWTVSPEGRHEPPSGSAYRQLARWLARAMADGATDGDGMRAIGRTVGHELAADGTAGDPVDALAALGFAPQHVDGDDAGTTLRLACCPYREAVIENQSAICGLHRGLTEGLLDELRPGAQVTRFVAEDPRTAGCLITFTDASEA
jgi:predicted ArsR family transcriptional regulator